MIACSTREAAKLLLQVPVLLAASLAASQAPSQQPPPPGSLKTSVNLIEVPIIVRDQAGRQVTNLNAADFRIYDQGKLQTISRFRYVTPSMNSSVSPANVFSEPPSDTRGSNPAAAEMRSLLIVIPQLQMASRHFAFRALEKAFQRHAFDGISVAIVDNSALALPFTRDRDSLLRALETMKAKKVSPCSGAPWRPIAAERLLQMRSMPGRKFMVFFTDFVLDRTECGNVTPFLSFPDNSPHSLLSDALASNVSVYPVDPRGVVPVGPMGDASTSWDLPGSWHDAMNQISDALSYQTTVLGWQRQSLTQLAALTGGRAMAGNDLDRVFTMAQEDSSYYEIGYYLSDLQADGAYHPIRVELSRSNFHTLAKKGYFAPIPLAELSRGQKREWLYRALLADQPIEQIAINARSSVFYNPPTAVLSLYTGLEARWWAPVEAAKDDRRLTMLVGLVQNEHGDVVAHFDHTNFWHANQARREDAGYTLQDASYNLLVHLKPGRYVVKVAVADLLANIAGTFVRYFNVPEKLPSKFLVSSLVLSNHSVAVENPRNEADPDKRNYDNPSDSVHRMADDAAADPLVVEGRRLVPAVSRGFANTSQLTMFLRVYPRTDDGFPENWKMTGILQNASGKAIASVPATVVIPNPGESGVAVVCSFELSKFKLAEGKYRAELQMLRPGEKQPFYFRGEFAISGDASQNSWSEDAQP
jgi:VWFA-related protein